MKTFNQNDLLAFTLFCVLHAAFGPMIRTTDSDKMKYEISKLTANGGGDIPEMCLSGLQVIKCIDIVKSVMIQNKLNRFIIFIIPVGSDRCSCLFPHLCFHWCYSQRHRAQGYYCCSHQKYQVDGKYWHPVVSHGHFLFHLKGWGYNLPINSSTGIILQDWTHQQAPSFPQSCFLWWLQGLGSGLWRSDDPGVQAAAAWSHRRHSGHLHFSSGKTV